MQYKLRTIYGFSGVPKEELPFHGSLLTGEKLVQKAKTLAEEQEVRKGTENDYLTKRLDFNEKVINNFNNVTLALHKSYHITPATEWLIDNNYLIEEHIQLARRHFPKKYSRDLPSLIKGPYKGLPRVYAIVVNYISHVDAQVDEESLKDFFTGYQSVKLLKLGELWAVPIMLRLALIENIQRIAAREYLNQKHRELANYWVDKFEAATSEKASKLVEVVSDMAKSDVPLSSSFVSEFCQRLSSQNSALKFARSWLDQALAEEGLSVEEMINLESQNQASHQLSVSHSIISLRFLNSTDWKIFVETLSAVEKTLYKDPAGVYNLMDFATRDNYRHAIERLAKGSKFSEVEVAEKAVALAEVAYEKGFTPREYHVGYYLVSDGLKKLIKRIRFRRSFTGMLKHLLSQCPLTIYSWSIILITLLATVIFITSVQSDDLPFYDWRVIVLSLLFLVVASQLSVFLVNWLSTLIVAPDKLARLDFSEGIPKEYRTMIVIPTLISNNESVDKLLEDIEIHYLSNKGNYLHFALLTDFSDSFTENELKDARLVQRVQTGIKNLNSKYDSENHSLFYLFHRPRMWHLKEKCWMGYERKRGKLMALNSFLRGGPAECFTAIEGNIAILPDIKYIITLDTDTQLPPNAAAKLAGTMAHPLNRPVYDKRKNIVVKGYGILQPRVATTLQSSQSTLFSSLFTDEGGIDPYTRYVSDVYQDIFHEGTFVGKGIYDVDAFEKVLANRFPENKILSHDLLESTYVRSGLVTDIEIYENYPPGYNMDAKRRHRWVRGDWQIIEWLSPWVPTFSKVWEENPVKSLGRWKIADNLRRSLVPAAMLLFITGFCVVLPQYVWIGLIILIALALTPFIIVLATNAVRKSKDQSWALHFRELREKSGRQLKQVLVTLIMLPYDAYLNTHAIIITLWRLVVTHRHLLSWQASAIIERTASNSLAAFYKNMWFSPFYAVACGIALGFYSPILFLTLPFLIAWIIAPYIAWRISLPVKEKPVSFNKEQNLLLRRIARKTWHFFEKFVNESENWLPPDNFQEIPEPVIASRTSPTNIGLCLLSNLTAYDFGYISVGKVIERVKNTVDTINKLQKYRGHLYNWYDTRTLEPLYPLYVSSVDSGNLAGHLITLNEGLRDIENKPVYSPVIFEGLLDTIRVMRFIDKKNIGLQKIEKDLFQKPCTIYEAYLLLQSVKMQMELILPNISYLYADLEDWCKTFLANCEDHLNELLYLSPYIKFMDAASAEHLEVKVKEQFRNCDIAFSDIVRKVPTLQQIVDFEEKVTAKMKFIRKNFEENEYLCGLLRSFRESAEHASTRINQLRQLSRDCESLSKMDMSFLYNHEKKLFSIGYNVSEQRNDTGYYDLLASEARVCSYIAIAQRQIPEEHWFSLSRLLILQQGKPMLLSWSGSMFEYLMPLLVMPNFKGTLFDSTYKGIVQEQIQYARKLNIPWGISESGYNRTDSHFNYQYKAFGIPSLGLKRGLSKDLVIAPYATLLGLMVYPRKSCENMQKLSLSGFESNYGYYEAVDYTPGHLPSGESHVIIRSFMAHHQGMSLISLGNLLKDNVMQKRFIACPMAKAFELLLQERVPHSITANIIEDDSKFEMEGLHPLAEDNSNIIRTFTDTDIFPEVNILTNGRYKVMINNNGAGYSQWNNLAVTRWREDSTSDSHGLFIYMRDVSSGEFWSIGNQPTLKPVKNYEVRFTQAYTEIQQKNRGLHIKMVVCISPEDDIEIRRVTITNHSAKTKTVELTTFSEVVIAPQEADEAHPSFSNLFVQTKFHPETSALICTRRSRSEEEKPPYLIHLMRSDSLRDDNVSYETDRTKFIGRGKTVANPLAMQTKSNLSGTVGSVLDPSISIRRTVVIPPGKTANISIVLGVAETESQAILLAEKYQNDRMTDRAFELAWTHSQVRLHQIGITESEAQLYAKFTGALVYVNPAYRADTSLLKNNRRGQNSLWAYSLSGDVPIVLLRIKDLQSKELVKQLVQAHAYWRLKGIIVELMILNEDTSVYRQTVQDEIISMISTGVEAPQLEKPGGIFVRRIEQIPQEDLVLLQSNARIIFTDEKGSLIDHIAKTKPVKLHRPLIPIKSPRIYVYENPVEKDELVLFNGIGGFTKDGSEYVIKLNPGDVTPAPWSNVIANPNFGTVITESGGSYTWAINAREFRITPWNNDPLKDTSGEAIYIRDEDSGQYWSPTPLPARGSTPYTIRHGFGYTIFIHVENGIYSELCVYVSIDATVKFSVLKLKNLSGNNRRISVTGYYEWILSDRRSKSLLNIQTELDTTTGVLYARNFYNPDFAGKIAFLDVGEIKSVTADRREFLGQNGDLSSPAAMSNIRLSGRVCSGMDTCAAMRVSFDLDDDEERTVNFRLGFANFKAEMNELVTRFREKGSAANELTKVKNYWKKTLETVKVNTPDVEVNVMANGWLLYQTLCARIWARTGYYQSGGAYGFRDQLQDSMALINAEPAITRNQILLSARHQFTKGDVQHWWHPPFDRGVRTHFSDDYLWLPYVTSYYIKSTGDTGILDEVIPFIQGRELAPDEESYYDLPLQSEENATLYEHCVRSIRYGLKFGEHGLPLMGCGDWNDGMNLVGIGGKGESVWLGFFLFDVLQKFVEIAIMRNEEDFANFCLQQSEQLKQNINNNAWDGEWYRRAYFDNGEPLGSKNNEECTIDALPQSWSIISGAGEPERSIQGMDKVDKMLVNRSAKLIQLFNPPFDKTPLNPGYIKGYIPGVRENGGQYTHGAIWTALGFAMMGNAAKAWELFDLINPVNHAATAENVYIYKVEPYVVAADVYASPQHLGRGGWTWYTGSAAWLYRLLVETLLGIYRMDNRLKLMPLMRPEWNSYKVDYRYYSTPYHIQFNRISDNSSERKLLLDGTKQPDVKILSMVDDRKEHVVDVWL